MERLCKQSRWRVGLACCSALGLLWACSGAPQGSGALGVEEQPFAPFRHELGSFVVELVGPSWSAAQLRVTHRDRPGFAVFETLPGRAFLDVARGQASWRPGQGVEDDVHERCPAQTIDEVQAEGYALRLSGRLRCPVLDRTYELFVVPETRRQLRFHVRLMDGSFNRIALTHRRAPDERIFGLGARARFEHAGTRLASLVTDAPREPPGLGTRLWRGLAGGSAPPEGSRAPAPHLFTSAGRTLLVEDDGYVSFDLSRAGEIRTEVHAPELTWRVLRADAPPARVGAATALAGRMARPPAWIDAGPILAASGSVAEARSVVDDLARRGVLPAALWVRDAGPADEFASLALAPGWAAWQPELRARGVRLLLPAGPWAATVSPAPGDAAPPTPGLADAEAEGAATGLAPRWVGTETGAAAPPDRALLDLSTPGARDWLAARLRASHVARGAAGLVLAGGAALPFAGRLAGDRAGAVGHNVYAAQLAEAAASAFAGADGALLVRTAFVGSSPHGTIFHAGAIDDPATVARILSAGLSGYAVPWVELSAATPRAARERSFGLAGFTPVFSVDTALLDDDAARDALARAARIHAAWAGYRGELFRQARTQGLPVLRPLWLHHPDEPAFQAAEPAAFLVGSELLVIPVRDDAPTLEATLPPGRWIDLYTGDAFGDATSPARVQRLAVRRGLPVVLHPEGSIVGERLGRALAWLASE